MWIGELLWTFDIVNAHNYIFLESEIDSISGEKLSKHTNKLNLT